MKQDTPLDARASRFPRTAWIAIGLAAISIGFVLGRVADDDLSAAPAPIQHAEGAGALPVPVVVELFTSQGCSSCPPADRLLAELVAEQPVPGVEIVPLSEHVDYWNRLGWIDPFSSEQFSERQRIYAHAAGSRRIYTPQMMIDGRFGLVGSERKEALAQIAKASMAPRGKVELSACDTALACWQVEVADLPEITDGDTARVVYAVTESNLEVEVKKGENAGRELAHVAVVRELGELGNVGDDGVFSGRAEPRLESDWRRENLRLVVFVQENASRRILGAAQIPLG